MKKKKWIRIVLPTAMMFSILLFHNDKTEGICKQIEVSNVQANTKAQVQAANTVPTTAQTEDVHTQAGKAYAKIIKRYLDAYELAQKDAYDFDKIEDDGINLEFVSAARSSKEMVYRVMDYNQDSTPELFLGLRMQESSGFIYDVYTFDAGKAVQLMEGIGYRAGTCSFCKNNIINDSWSNSAAKGGVTFHKMPKDKKELIDFVVLIHDYESGAGVFTKKVNGRVKTIDQAEYDRIYNKYDKPVKITFYKADQKAIKKMKNGKFAYSGQKKWRMNT